ncbi:DUF3152 domain-containing protein, partial [Phytoactinopolyspora endophytica]|uniref:DUF3152 domain-containing protein n=1 Tax=Phytoactinopolyspora endophytica TaxID=1642495 RepID=UPI00197B6656
MTGAHRGGRRRRISARRTLPTVTALAALGAVAFVVASGGITLGDETATPSDGTHVALGDGEADASDDHAAPDRSADDDASRGDRRSLGDGPSERPTLDPTVAITVSGPEVNGRSQPAPVDPPQSGEGTYQIVSGTDPAPDRLSGDVERYIVEVEEGLPFDPEEFAAQVHTILNDDRGWGHDGSVRFERVDSGPVSIRVSLSSADLTDDECYPLLTQGRVSCWNGSRAVINAERWGKGADTF